MAETPPVAGESCRYRITFATRFTLAYVSVLELGIVWERALRRAGIPLRYSQGFNPRPRLAFAAPLPVGCGSEADLLDLWLTEAWPPERVHQALSETTLPRDLIPLAVRAVPEGEPALSEQLVEAHYRLWLKEVPAAELEAAVARLLAAERLVLPRRGRKFRGKVYDLRPLLLELRAEAAPPPWLGLRMRLAARPGATGRPDEVLKALGLEDAPRRCTRTALVLAPPEA